MVKFDMLMVLALLCAAQLACQRAKTETGAQAPVGQPAPDDREVRQEAAPEGPPRVSIDLEIPQGDRTQKVCFLIVRIEAENRDFMGRIPRCYPEEIQTIEFRLRIEAGRTVESIVSAILDKIDEDTRDYGSRFWPIEAHREGNGVVLAGPGLSCAGFWCSDSSSLKCAARLSCCCQEQIGFGVLGFFFPDGSFPPIPVPPGEVPESPERDKITITVAVKAAGMAKSGKLERTLKFTDGQEEVLHWVGDGLAAQGVPVSVEKDGVFFGDIGGGPGERMLAVVPTTMFRSERADPGPPRKNAGGTHELLYLMRAKLPQRTADPFAGTSLDWDSKPAGYEDAIRHVNQATMNRPGADESIRATQALAHKWRDRVADVVAYGLMHERDVDGLLLFADEHLRNRALNAGIAAAMNRAKGHVLVVAARWAREFPGPEFLEPLIMQVPRCWNPEAHAFASEALFVITQGEIGAEKVDAASIEDRNRRTAERRWRDWFDRKQNQGGK